MDMPFDLINRRLGAIRDNGDIDFDNTAAAVDLDMELQAKFLFFPFEEIDAIEVAESRDRIYAGVGEAYAACSVHTYPDELLRKAENLLALRHRILMNREEEAEAAKIAARPAPGIYALNTGGERHIAIVTADRRILTTRHMAQELNDFTHIYDGLENKSRWTFTPVETGLSAGTVEA